MRILGLDFGLKRVGVAFSDEGFSIAFPQGILPNDKNLLVSLTSIIKEKEIKEIIIGESLNLHGEENSVNKDIKLFAEKIKASSGLPIFFEKEFLSSKEARRTTITKSSKDQSQANSRVKKEKLGKVDHNAAAIILQRYLDRKKLNNINL